MHAFWVSHTLLLLCPECEPEAKANSLLNCELTRVHHAADRAGRVGETLNRSEAGHLLGVEQGEWESGGFQVA